MSYAPYNKNAKRFFTQYQSLTFEQVHSDWLPQLDKNAFVCDGRLTGQLHS